MRLAFQFVGGATWVLREGDFAVACDPVLCPKGSVQDYRAFASERLEAPEPAALHDIDLWLLTHGHLDHLDGAGAAAVHDSQVFAHRSALKAMPALRASNAVRVLRRGEEAAFSKGGLRARVRAVSATHGRNGIFGALVGNGNGYLLELHRGQESATVLIAGDSVYSGRSRRELRGVEPGLVVANAGGARIGDSLLSRMVGRITNEATDLCRLAREIRPAALVVVHQGTFSHYAERLDARSPALAEAAGLAELHVPRPGEAIELDIGR